MIRSLKDLTKHSFRAIDGDVGRVHDFYFDDQDWAVRYLVADTGRWLPGRKVLLAPESIERIDWRARIVHLDLTKEQIERSPSTANDEPVSRQKEVEMFEHYGWRPYWLATPFPRDQGPGVVTAASELPRSNSTHEPPEGDPHLRSVEEVIGYDATCTDDNAGVIDDIACDDEPWLIRYLVVDTHRWLPGRKMLVAPQWTTGIDWSANEVRIDLTRERLERSPEFDPHAPIQRRYEERLYDFYGRPRYWSDQEARSRA